MKKARKQIIGPKPKKQHSELMYNIWYHKNSFPADGWEDTLIKSATKCDLSTDQGLTKATKDSFLCLHFIRGECVFGYDCKYFHHILSPHETTHIPITKDIFGRDRHSTDLEDMSGVGNFNKENCTLFIGKLPGKAGDIYNLLLRNFSEWGEIEDLNIPSDQSIAFVRYKRRHSAEIAKEAMKCQSLGFGDVLKVRWAFDNPAADKRKEVLDKEKAIAGEKFMKAAIEFAERTNKTPMEYSEELLKQTTRPVKKNEYLYNKKVQKDYHKSVNDYYKSLDKVKKDDSEEIEKDLDFAPPGISKKVNNKKKVNKNNFVNKVPFSTKPIQIEKNGKYRFPDISKGIDEELRKRRKVNKI